MWPVDSSLTHIIVIKVGKYTFGGHLLVEMFFGGICFEYLYFTSLLRNTNTHRKEKIRKYI